MFGSNNSQEPRYCLKQDGSLIFIPLASSLFTSVKRVLNGSCVLRKRAGMASSNSSTSIFQHDDSAPSEILKHVPEFSIGSIHVDAPNVHDLRISDVDQQEYVIVGVGLLIGHTPDDYTIPLNTISDTASSSNNSSGQSLHFVGVEERGTMKKTDDIITHRYMLCTRSGRPKLQDFDSTAYSSNPVYRRRSSFKVTDCKAPAAKEAADKFAATSGSVFDISVGPSSHPYVELPTDPSFCFDVDLSDGPSSGVVVDRSSRYARRSSSHDTDVTNIITVPSSWPAVTRSARRTTRSSGPSAV
ncbi:hypothetical protein L1987_37742 [Smallanthus sonchifolius]|uniref:Uncharacterized protein n=1 Tax=Smallanthus sonchifolius TaxID=185202 RepID=A0ACB9HH62_9ASTR|nr:hypothetical protein L1987_37742 [Smallanthus sonchifolius]